MLVDVQYTGVTMGIVLQTTVDEVTTEVLVLVLVTRGGLVS